jgi:hypothetical protein
MQPKKPGVFRLQAAGLLMRPAKAADLKSTFSRFLGPAPRYRFRPATTLSFRNGGAMGGNCFTLRLPPVSRMMAVPIIISGTKLEAALLYLYSPARFLGTQGGFMYHRQMASDFS